MTTRDRSRSALRLLIYMCPALIDMVVAQVLFVSTVRAARLGIPASVVAVVVTAFSLVYTAVCPLVGRLLSPRNAGALVRGACLALGGLCLAFGFVPGKAGIFVLPVLTGAAAAVFFCSFQVFMKAVDTAGGKPVTYSTGLYTFAWSMGFAAGPFVSGFLLEMGAPSGPLGEPCGWRYALFIGAAVATATAAGMHRLRSLAEAPGGPESPAPAPADARGIDYSQMKDLAWLGWIVAGVGIAVLACIRAVFPVRAMGELGIPESRQGLLFFALNVTQAFTGLALMRSRLWMYRPWAVAAFGLAGVAGAVLFGVGRGLPVLLVACVVFGLYSGAFFFYLVFHALAHPLRSARYVAINESVVGISGIVGPIAGGLIAERVGSGVPYLAGAAVVVAVTAFQAAVHRRYPPPAVARSARVG